MDPSTSRNGLRPHGLDWRWKSSSRYFPHYCFWAANLSAARMGSRDATAQKNKTASRQGNKKIYVERGGDAKRGTSEFLSRPGDARSRPKYPPGVESVHTSKRRPGHSFARTAAIVHRLCATANNGDSAPYLPRYRHGPLLHLQPKGGRAPVDPIIFSLLLWESWLECSCDSGSS